MSNYTSKKATYKDKEIQAKEESLKSMKSLQNILYLVSDLDKTDRRALIRILKRSDDFKDIIEKEND